MISSYHSILEIILSPFTDVFEPIKRDKGTNWGISLDKNYV